MSLVFPGVGPKPVEEWGLIDLIGEPVVGEDAEVDAILAAPELSPAIREVLIAAFTLARLVDPDAATAAGVRPAACVLGYAHLLLDEVGGRSFADIIMECITDGRTAVTSEQLRRADLSYERLYGQALLTEAA